MASVGGRGITGVGMGRRWGDDNLAFFKGLDTRPGHYYSSLARCSVLFLSTSLPTYFHHLIHLHTQQKTTPDIGMSLAAHLFFLSGHTFTQNPMLFLCSLMVSPRGSLHLLSLHTWHFALTSLWLSPSLPQADFSANYTVMTTWPLFWN